MNNLHRKVGVTLEMPMSDRSNLSSLHNEASLEALLSSIFLRLHCHRLPVMLLRSRTNFARRLAGRDRHAPLAHARDRGARPARSAKALK